MFTVPLKLNYKGAEAFQSSTGAVITLMVRTIILAFMVVEVIDMLSLSVRRSSIQETFLPLDTESYTGIAVNDKVEFMVMFGSD